MLLSTSNICIFKATNSVASPPVFDLTVLVNMSGLANLSSYPLSSPNISSCKLQLFHGIEGVIWNLESGPPM